jgi:hypothetical protein
VDLTLYQSPSHPSVPFFELPVPVLFKNANTDTLIVLDNTTNGELFSFNLPFQADSAILDPDLWLISGQNIVTRVNELAAADAEVVLFPNPAATALTVRVPAAQGRLNARVLDAYGRAVRTFTLAQGNGDVDVSVLAQGAYVLELRNGDRTWTQRFVKE